MEDEQDDYKDSFSIGTASTGGTIRVYFNDATAEQKIARAKQLYFKFVESDKIRKQL